MAAAILVSSVASGQASIPLDRYEPAVVGSRLFTLDDPEYRGHLRPRLGMALDYAHRPLVVEADGGSEGGAIVDHQVTLHLQGSIELFERLLVEFDAPATLSQDGDSPEVGGRRFSSPTGGALNDLRLGARVGLWRQHGAWPAAALGVSSWLPTGDEGAYTGSRRARFGGLLVAGSDYDWGLWRVSLGRRRQVNQTEIDTARSDWTFAAGAAVKLGALQLGPELHGATANDAETELLAEDSTGLEALLGARYTLGDWLIGAAAGPGLNTSPGTPKVRAIIGIAWAPGAAAPGVARPNQEPVARSAPVTGGSSLASPVADGSHTSEAPVPAEIQASSDRDGDGILDAVDDCPDVLGVPGAAAPRRGCPSDTDSDGIVDASDACPAEAGVASDDPKRFGCPPDTDGDGIIDAMDGCPEERGEAHSDPKRHGCRPAVVVQGEQLVLVKEIRFETGSDRILEESAETMSQMAALMNEQEQIVRVAVDGHTDDVGDQKKNLALSRRRALSVVRWLVEHGVDERRLEARGFGPRRPLAPNDSEDARARNRRVEFHVLKRSPRGREDWKDGPIDE